jgi:hypothetical protein
LTQSKTGARKLTAAERRKQALELRKAGFTYQQIADQLGFTRTAAYKTVKVALDDINQNIKDEAATVRTLELERLDRLWVEMYRRAKGGDYGAVDRCLRIQERRSKLLGLDAPQKVEQEITDHVIHVTIEDDGS